jgi:hypothetical protein
MTYAWETMGHRCGRQGSILCESGVGAASASNYFRLRVTKVAQVIHRYEATREMSILAQVLLHCSGGRTDVVQSCAPGTIIAGWYTPGE